MKRILHILKQNNPTFLSIIQQQVKEDDVEVILIQDAIEGILPNCAAVFELIDHISPKTGYPLISYKEFIEKIFRADTVVTW